MAVCSDTSNILAGFRIQSVTSPILVLDNLSLSYLLSGGFGLAQNEILIWIRTAKIHAIHRHLPSAMENT